MGLRCLLGHDYGDPEIERERREDGNEMVVTVREVRTCDRCGERQVLSENKEVTTIRTPAELGLDDDAATAEGTTPPDVSADAGADRGGATDDGPDAAEPDRDADGEAGDAAPADAPTVEAEGDTAETAPGADAAPASAADEDAADAGEGGRDDAAATTTDDGIILEDDGAARGRGEWPDPDGEEADTAPERDATRLRGAAETATREEIEGDGAVATGNVTDDAEFIDADGDAAGAGGAGGTGGSGSGDASADDPAATRAESEADDSGGQVAWPEHDDPGVPERDGATTEWPEHEGEDEGFAAGSVDDETEVSLGGNELTPEVNGRTPDLGSAETGEDFVRAGDAPTEERRSPGESVGSVFYCPNCSFEAPVGAASVRAGDICPDCRRGYVAEREE